MTKHWRFLLFLILPDLLLLAGLALPGRVRRLTETVWTVRLAAGGGLYAALAAASGAAVAEHAGPDRGVDGGEGEPCRENRRA